MRNVAWKFLLEHKVSELPVNAFALAAKCGCETMNYEKFSLYVKKPVEYIKQEYGNDGFVFWSVKFNSFIICYNDKMSADIIRRTIVHEIAHIALGHVKQDDFSLKARTVKNMFMEIEADEFAMDVLCPPIVLHDCRATSANAIMKLCGISFTAAEYRSDYMKTLEARMKWRTDPREVEVEQQFLPFILRYLRTDFLVEFAMELTA